MFINKTINNKSIIYDHDKLYIIVTIYICYYGNYVNLYILIYYIQNTNLIDNN